MPFLDKLLTSGGGSARAHHMLAARTSGLFPDDMYRGSGSDGEVLSSRVSKPSLDEENRVCGAEGCSSWLMPWKNRRRPIFEGEWGCSNRCIATMVRTAVRRELMEGGATAEMAPHRHRVPLGLVLLAQGWITHPQLQTALEAQRMSGEGRIGDWLVHGGLQEERVTRGLGVQWSCPVLALDGFSPETMGLVMPKRFVAEFGMLPLRVAGSSILYLAFDDRMDASAALALEHMSGLKAESGLLSSTQMASLRAGLLEAETVPLTVDTAADGQTLAAKVAKLIEQHQPLASRLVRIHQYYWLRTWLESGAFSGVGNLPSGTEDVHDYLFTIERV